MLSEENIVTDLRKLKFFNADLSFWGVEIVPRECN